MGTMAGWATRKAKKAAERAERDAVMKAVGAANERIRIREELLAAFVAARHTYRDNSGTWLLSEPALLRHLDRICPVGAKPATADHHHENEAQETALDSTTSSR